MTLQSYENQSCPIAQALRLIGDQWTLLILRDALWGVSRFEDFQKKLGISRNLLAQRLRQLTEQGLLEREPIEGSRRFAYRPTESARDLRTVLAALAEWGARWQPETTRTRIVYSDKEDGEPVGVRFVRLSDGGLVDRADVRVERHRLAP